jgi:hypothetical protein
MYSSNRAEIESLLAQQELIEARLGFWQGVALAFVRAFAPWLVPIAPAGFVGYEVWVITAALMPAWLALAVALAAAIGLETVGAITSDTALELYTHWLAERVGAGKVAVGFSLVLGYLIIGVATVLFLNRAGFLVAGAGMFGLAGLVYFSQALTLDVRRLNRQAMKAESAGEVDRSLELERQQAAAERDHQLRLKELELEFELKARRVAEREETKRQSARSANPRAIGGGSTAISTGSTAPAVVAPQPAESYTCEDCGRSFGSKQALGAHGRFCEGAVSDG